MAGVEGDASEAFDEAQEYSQWVDAHCTRALHAVLTAPGMSGEERLQQSCWTLLRAAQTLETLLREV